MLMLVMLMLRVYPGFELIGRRWGGGWRGQYIFHYAPAACYKEREGGGREREGERWREGGGVGAA